MLWVLEKKEEAEGLYREALKLWRELSKEKSDNTDMMNECVTYSNLAILLEELDRLDEAESMYREAAGLYRRLAKENLSEYGPGLLRVYNNLINLLEKTGQEEKAEEIRQETFIYC